MTDFIETVVVGAGVIGLAIARELALAGHEVLVLEREGGIGKGISSRNSEVIHAGLYYPKESLKARSCVEGRELLYDYCRARHIPHNPCGKLIVAADETQVAQLEALHAAGEANGVEGLKILDAAALKQKEPDITGAAALWSPLSGIIDSHAYMLALQGDLENADGRVVLHSAVERIAPDTDGFTAYCDDVRLQAKYVVNCAGLQAAALASTIEGLPVPKAYMAKGSYFILSGKCPFTHLVYPLPEPGGLGVHLTLDLGGQGRFGPDVQWVEAEDYAVDPARGELFYAAIRRYWPGLPDGALQPGYSGIRPKLAGPGQAAADFMVQDGADFGLPGLLTLYGIESPGLTASLSLAKTVKNRLFS